MNALGDVHVAANLANERRQPRQGNKIVIRARSNVLSRRPMRFTQLKGQRSWSICRPENCRRKYGLVSLAVDPIGNGYYFDRDAIRTLRRIESLRSVCGDDLPGIKIILDLMSQLERLQSEVRSTRESTTKGTKKGPVH
jgi:MerR HTH family regulatory protein